MYRTGNLKKIAMLQLTFDCCPPHLVDERQKAVLKIVECAVHRLKNLKTITISKSDFCDIAPTFEYIFLFIDGLPLYFHLTLTVHVLYCTRSVDSSRCVRTDLLRELINGPLLNRTYPFLSVSRLFHYYDEI